MGVPSIGGYSLTDFKGAINSTIGVNVEKCTRPGVSGVAYRKIGKQPDPDTVQTISDHASKASAETAISNYKGLEGTLVDVIDPGGTTHSNVMVRDVKIVDIKPVATPVGGVNAGTWLVFAQWILEYTTVS